jgi:CRP/FNR family transcriptional regulator, nitrogen oxide reductase regulator
MTLKSFISTLDVFKDLPADQLPAIEARMIERRFAKGETIFLEGDPAQHVWFIREGHIKAVIHSASGRDQTLCMMGTGNMFGTCCCFGGGMYPCHTIAETETTVVSLPLKDFLALLETYPSLSGAVVSQLSLRLRQAKHMQTLEQESVEKRVLHVLVNLVAEFGNTIPLTRREVAEMAGTTVETCIRTLSRLEADGLVSGARGKIVVRNPHDLTARIEGLA